MATLYTPGPEYLTFPPFDLLYRIDIGRARERLANGHPVSKRFRALIERSDREGPGQVAMSEALTAAHVTMGRAE